MIFFWLDDCLTTQVFGYHPNVTAPPIRDFPLSVFIAGKAGFPNLATLN